MICPLCERPHILLKTTFCCPGICQSLVKILIDKNQYIDKDYNFLLFFLHTSNNNNISLVFVKRSLAHTGHPFSLFQQSTFKTTYIVSYKPIRVNRTIVGCYSKLPKGG